MPSTVANREFRWMIRHISFLRLFLCFDAYREFIAFWKGPARPYDERYCLECIFTMRYHRMWILKCKSICHFTVAANDFLLKWVNLFLLRFLFDILHLLLLGCCQLYHICSLPICLCMWFEWKLKTIAKVDGTREKNNSIWNWFDLIVGLKITKDATWKTIYFRLK